MLPNIQKTIAAFVVIVLSFAVSTAFVGCQQKGCTNRNALNFNSTADKDDGSCIICTATTEDISSQLYYLVDQNSFSPHYNQIVAIFSFKQSALKYNDSNCGSDVCQVSYTIQSQVSENMTFNYTVQSFNNVFINTGGDASLSGGQTIDKGVIDKNEISNACQPLQSGDIVVFTSTDIQYH